MAPISSNTKAQILVVDDEPDLRTLYELTLLREGYRVETASTLAEAWSWLQAQRFDVLITDMRLPDGLGVELLNGLRAQQRGERCIVITAYGSPENAVESLKAGAFDYLTKPVDLMQFRAAIASAMHATAARPVLSARAEPTGTSGQAALERLVGESAAMRGVRERIAKVARSMAPVLLQGESGTGKELVASALHCNSHRANGAWVAVNCSAIPETLLEAEFFGTKKGAYTGAAQDREGFFQAAKGGTLFLDEIGDLPLPMQSKLLRAIQERCVRPLGANQEEAVDVRIISATHKNLPAEVLAGRFRQDLFYRLNVIDITIAPLRERREDIGPLCHALLARIAAESETTVPQLSDAFIAELLQLPLEGNVRELENLLHRAVALCEGDTLSLSDLRQHANAPAPEVEIRPPESSAEPDDASTTRIPANLQHHLDQQERRILIQTLRETQYNRTQAANRLGLTLRQIRYRIDRLKIELPGAHNEDSDA